MSKKAGSDILSILGRGSSKITKPTHSNASPIANLEVKLSQTPSLGLRVPGCKAGWTVKGSHLVQYVPKQSIFTITPPHKIASFDLDDTLVRTKSGGKFAVNGDDWQFINGKVVPKLHQLWADGYVIVIFTNQGGVVADSTLKSFIKLKARVGNVVDAIYGDAAKSGHLMVFGSPKYPKAKTYKGVKSAEAKHAEMRKPQVGMWTELVKAMRQEGDTGDTELIDMENSYFVGDAAGRKGDFSDSDLKFAKNAGLTFFTPEEFF
ncbi:hypothetical protein BABINDRAFT_162007 [Babjeviella inositovora NRRL Y-12698]|uniref:PNK FHA domain-containing protein n=1 Tax=Babjeviella inositovora NRRL Y-12698 TaxID=984486 RepID=A0A1E3QRQ9_9ASCO|nr:uncharacterized protein BABINDRAFT_162007 [Babjeviella inositovora NRRL Y-12698]ODQ79627.1 hypothetical protein BABINDRAFT_162007 [Babjeviella inositovora NRRL Y-12698]